MKESSPQTTGTVTECASPSLWIQWDLTRVRRSLRIVYSGAMLMCTIPLHSFFWAETENTIEQLAHTADSALHDHRLVEARDVLEHMVSLAISDAGGKKISWPLLIEYSMKLAYTCEALGETEAALDVLNQLLQRDLPAALTPKILLMKARLSASHYSPEASYLLLKNLSKEFPMDYWSREDVSLFQALTYALDEHFDNQLKKAKRLFVTGGYAEAARLYEEVLHAIEQSSFPRSETQGELLKKKIRYALAECAFAESDYVRSLSYIEDGVQSPHAIDRESLYLMAMCYKQQQDYERSIHYLLEYTQKEGGAALSHYDHALLELGLYYYQRQQWDRAREYLTNLVNKSKEGRPLWVGSLYLARLLLQAHEVAAAATVLEKLCALPVKDPLFAEWCFLRGEVAYEQGCYAEARLLYEQSGPSASASGWRVQAYHQLAWCYIQSGCCSHISSEERIHYFSHATSMLEELLPYPVAALSLSKLAILRHQWCNDPSELPLVEGWIQKHFGDLSFAEQHEALLVRAAATSDPIKKQSLLAKATDTCYSSVPTYVSALYEKSRCSMTDMNKEPQDNIIAEEALLTVLSLDPHGPHGEESRYLLGSLYFQKKDFQSALPLFDEVAAGNHALAAPALFFAAETLMALDKDAARALAYRKALYRRFPDSSYAADSCFRCFPISAYLSGEPSALEHLTQFPILFPGHALTIAAHYVLSLHQDTLEAISSLDQSIGLFESLYRGSGVPDEETLRFYYESLYERGIRSLEIHHWDEGVGFLSKINDAFYEPTTLYMDRLKAVDPLPEVVAKSLYRLATHYMDQGQRSEAESILYRLLIAYKNLGIQHALYLSLAWQVQGELALLDHEYERALDCFDIAEEAGREMRSDIQAMELWLWKGKTQFQAGALDQAMRTSSKIINSGLEHPFCAEAMLLRAEIYLLQGRPDLASRQWEAMIKKGGWAAIRAEEKLRKGAVS